MLQLVISVLPILCHGRTGKGLWDQLPVHGGNQYHRQVDTGHQLPSYQYYSDINTQLPPVTQQFQSDSYTSYQLPQNSRYQYEHSDRQLPSTGGYSRGKNTLQKRTLVIDDTDDSDDDKHHSPAGFWGQMVNKGAKGSGIDAHSRHSAVGISSRRSNRDNQNKKNLRSHKKQSSRKDKPQKKTERPVTLRSLIDEYIDDYDEFYDYEFYDDTKSESDVRDKNSNVHTAHGSQEGENEALRAHRLNAKTLKQLQSRPKVSSEHNRGKGKATASRRLGVFSDRNDIDATIGAMEELLGLNSKDVDSESGEKRLVAQINAVAVLDMIKNLQDEIKDINDEIDRENIKMKRLKEQKKNIRPDDEFEIPVQNVAQISTEETMKELTLQKEDTKMKKVIAQLMLMKQIQKKKEENIKLEMALKKLAERREIINAALKQQKQIADEKREKAMAELKRQKKLMSDREHLISMLKQQKEEASRSRQKEQQQQQQQKQNMQRNQPQFQSSRAKLEREKILEKQKLQRNKPQQQKTRSETIAEKSKLLDAHKLLVDKSNERILAKIEEIKIARQKEAISEQQKLLQEQQSAINVLRELKKQRLKKQKESVRIKQQKKKQRPKVSKRPKNPQSSKSKLVEKLRSTMKSPALNLDLEDKKKVLEWLDLERNAAILEKTDKAIAEKLRAKNAAQNQPVADKVKSAAQVLLDAEQPLSDSEIDNILGLTGITEADRDILGLDDPSIITFDDPSILDLDENFEYDDYEDDDYEYYEDYEDYQYYDETDYDDYDDEAIQVEYDYEYDDVPIVIKSKPHKPKKKLHGHFLPVNLPQQIKPNSGSKFLNDVTDILGQAEDYLDYGEAPHLTLSGSLRNALLRDIDDHVRTEVNRLPGGRVSTKVTIGGRASAKNTSNQRKIPKKIGSRRKSNREDHESGAFSDLMSHKKSKHENSHKISFSEMMGDLLQS